jgi:hypothetical protein
MATSPIDPERKYEIVLKSRVEYEGVIYQPRQNVRHKVRGHVLEGIKDHVSDYWEA